MVTFFYLSRFNFFSAQPFALIMVTDGVVLNSLPALLVSSFCCSLFVGQTSPIRTFGGKVIPKVSGGFIDVWLES